VSGVDAAAVAHNVALVRSRIAAAGGHDVELVAVTKTFPPDAIRAALAAGCRAIGENYAQELLAKVAELDRDGYGIGATAGTQLRPELHFIGHLQTNKVRSLAPVVSVWQSVDRASVIDELAKRAPGARLFVQVNVTGQPQQGGCPPEDVAALVARATAAALRVEGLMTIGALGDPVAARSGFRWVRACADELGLRGCSMGMSDDLELAVAEGATHVRVGSALFGPRVRDRGDGLR
jgi:PLP dependent protein